MIKLQARELAKSFGFRKVFDGISFSLSVGQSLAVVGPNGSGKTTLLGMIAGLYRPSRGKIEYSENERNLPTEKFQRQLAYIAPYITFYEALSAAENLRFFTAVSGIRINNNDIAEALARVGLAGRGDDQVGAYSSGMKQRLMYALALLKEPAVWIIDEPSANLDESGRETAFDIIKEAGAESIVVVATNEKEEYSLGETICRLG